MTREQRKTKRRYNRYRRNYRKHTVRKSILSVFYYPFAVLHFITGHFIFRLLIGAVISGCFLFRHQIYDDCDTWNEAVVAAKMNPEGFFNGASVWEFLVFSVLLGLIVAGVIHLIDHVVIGNIYWTIKHAMDEDDFHQNIETRKLYELEPLVKYGSDEAVKKAKADDLKQRLKNG